MHTEVKKESKKKTEGKREENREGKEGIAVMGKIR